MFSTARFARDAESAEGRYIFFSAERAEKKKCNSVLAVKITAAQMRTRLRTTFFIEISMLLFVFLPLKGKQIKE
jgi:hypothetical protein